MIEKEIKYVLEEEEMDNVCCCHCGGSSLEITETIVFRLDEYGDTDYDEVLDIRARDSNPYCGDCSVMTKLITKRQFVDYGD